ncbi:MAG: macro domain-containing protein [Lachnospiraceae bacterium]|nr:macro domain-containing protein [Lachnospiraceae bacterium]
MPFQIIRNDITRVTADAIVNTANPKPVIGSGTDRAIYKAAGEELLLKERQKIGNIAPGQAAYTSAFHLNAKYIIHTVGPAWISGNQMEKGILHSCYEKSLHLAEKLGCQSIAFPLIATGIYGFPKDEALQIALAEINKFLLSYEMKVILVVFDRKSFELSGRLVGEIRGYIDEHSLDEIRDEEYGSYNVIARRERAMRSDGLHLSMYPYSAEDAEANRSDLTPFCPDLSSMSLDEMLENEEDTFQQRLFKLIDESGMDDVTVYKKANIDRKVFSRIRCKEDYKPKKKTAVAFAIALQLDLPTMLDLLSRAGIAFSPSNKFDLIITYFIKNKIYDIYEINAALFKYGQPILGE